MHVVELKIGILREERRAVHAAPIERAARLIGIEMRPHGNQVRLRQPRNAQRRPEVHGGEAGAAGRRPGAAVARRGGEGEVAEVGHARRGAVLARAAVLPPGRVEDREQHLVAVLPRVDRSSVVEAPVVGRVVRVDAAGDERAVGGRAESQRGVGRLRTSSRCKCQQAGRLRSAEWRKGSPAAMRVVRYRALMERISGHGVHGAVGLCTRCGVGLCT